MRLDQAEVLYCFFFFPISTSPSWPGMKRCLPRASTFRVFKIERKQHHFSYIISHLLLWRKFCTSCTRGFLHYKVDLIPPSGSWEIGAKIRNFCDFFGKSQQTFKWVKKGLLSSVCQCVDRRRRGYSTCFKSKRLYYILRGYKSFSTYWRDTG